MSGRALIANGSALAHLTLFGGGAVFLKACLALGGTFWLAARGTELQRLRVLANGCFLGAQSHVRPPQAVVRGYLLPLAVPHNSSSNGRNAERCGHVILLPSTLN